MASIFKSILSLLPSGQKPQKKDSNAKFEVSYNGLTVGILTYHNGTWSFSYTQEFKQQSEVNSISDFPNTEKVYNSTILWPFFAVRIPGLKQPRVIEQMAELNISSSNQVDLLRHFGEKTISNPYQLIAKD